MCSVYVYMVYLVKPTKASVCIQSGAQKLFFVAHTTQLGMTTLLPYSTWSNNHKTNCLYAE